VTENVIAFEVRGTPVPQGSHRAFVVHGRAIVTHDNRRPLNDWRHLVRSEGQRHAPPAPWEGPVAVALQFRVNKPKDRPKTRRTWPDRKPDVDKLARGLIDSLTGVFFVDDAQVVALTATKDYGTPGVRVEIRRVVESAPLD
jgi:crossover junction endodeoxyribonuclease RusA